MLTKEDYLKILGSELSTALGCTEPIAVALASAKAATALDEEVKAIELLLCRNVFKNGLGVGIPGTEMKGLEIAAALGAFGGDADNALEVLTGIPETTVEKAQEFVKAKKVKLILHESDEKLFIVARLITDNHVSECKVIEHHTGVKYVKVDEKYIEEHNVEAEAKEKCCLKEELSIHEIFRFSQVMNPDEFSFLIEGAKMNKVIAKAGLNCNYTLGGIIMNEVENGILENDFFHKVVALTCAASEARMCGSALPVLTNSGSGNQGITITIPIYETYLHFKKSEADFIRALFVGHMVSIHLKNHLGILSCMCGAINAATGAGCGMSILLDGGEKELEYVIKNMLANLTGMICDGAKTSCGLKIASTISTALYSVLMARNGKFIGGDDGIIEDDIEKTIDNMGIVINNGMPQCDDVILNVMVNKKNKLEE